MSYPRILQRVYREPWCIKPSAHLAIQEALTNAMNGKMVEDYDEEEEEMESGESYRENSTVVIPVFGILGKHMSMLESQCGGCDVDQVGLALDMAMASEDVDTIILHIVSPGGSVTGIPELADKIRQASEVKEVVAYTDDLCASAAMWLASQCSAIYCSTSSELGSIGVYMALLDETEKMEKAGVKVNAISAGEFKLSGSSFQPLQQKEREMFQQDIDDIYEMFTSAVLSKLNVSKEHMQGQCFTGMKAVEVGLAHGVIDSIDDLLAMTLSHE